MARRFEGKNAIITGASSGIGKATAERLAAEGARVFLVARSQEKLAATATAIRTAGGTAHTCVADVSRAEDVQRCLREALTAIDGRIDVLINNAGVLHSAGFLEMSESDWDRVIDINLKGIFLVGQAVAREMARTGGGAIVNTSSVLGIVGDAEDSDAHYCASKGGVSLLTRQMALELARHRIRVNAVCPGFIDTPMNPEADLARDNPDALRRFLELRIPLGRTGRPEELAAVYAFLASDDASYMTGELVVVDGGMMAS